MKSIISFLLNKIFGLFKIQDNKIIFESGRNKVDDNPLAVYQYIKKEGIKDIKPMWIVTRETDVSALEKGDYCYYKTLKSYYHLATAKYKFRSQSIGSIIKKRQDQIYLYADHGCYGLKKCGYDLTNPKGRPPKDYTKEWDYYLGACDYSIKINTSATGYNGKSYDSGLARTDKLVNIDKNKVYELKKKYNLLDEKRPIVLYAPTFRDKDLENNICSYKIDKLCKLTNIKFIVTCHPQEKELAKDLDIPDNVINAIEEEINDLLLITDILITDYSSVIFDYFLLKRPVIFYPYDYDEYMTYRDFYLDYKKDLPGPICYTEEEVINVLNDTKSLDKYKEKIDEFNIKFNKENDGTVCKKIVDKIIKGEFN